MIIENFGTADWPLHEGPLFDEPLKLSMSDRRRMVRRLKGWRRYRRRYQNVMCDGHWHHLAIWRLDGRIRWYIDERRYA